MAALMRHLPANVRKAPRTTLHFDSDDTGESFDWDDSYRVTPPPVSVGFSDGFAGSRHSDVSCGGAKRTKRGMLAMWVAVVVGVVLALGVRWIKEPENPSAMALRSWVNGLSDVRVPEPERTQPVDLSELARHRRADARVVRDKYASIPGGVLFTPESLSSSDGSFDLLIHFHGNTKVVVESAVAAKLNAAIAIVNLGTGSGPYQQAYAAPGSYENLLAHIRSAVKRQGMENPLIRRVALSSWSAGYGAISTILEQRRGAEHLDAILVMDGIHTSYEDWNARALDERRLASFQEAADVAASGELLFSVTYSEIIPPGYAGSQATAEHLLSQAKLWGDLVRGPLSVPVYRKLPSMRGAIAKGDGEHLEPFSDVRVGDFHIRGYKGNRRGHHMAHLFQMGATVLPELAERWDSYAGFTGRTDAVSGSRVRLRALGRK